MFHWKMNEGRKAFISRWAGTIQSAGIMPSAVFCTGLTGGNRGLRSPWKFFRCFLKKKVQESGESLLPVIL